MIARNCRLSSCGLGATRPTLRIEPGLKLSGSAAAIHPEKAEAWPGPVLIKSYAPARPHAVRDEPCLMRLTTVAAMPASTALACGDFSMSMIGFDPGACP